MLTPAMVHIWAAGVRRGCTRISIHVLWVMPCGRFPPLPRRLWRRTTCKSQIEKEASHFRKLVGQLPCSSSFSVSIILIRASPGFHFLKRSNLAGIWAWKQESKLKIPASFWLTNRFPSSVSALQHSSWIKKKKKKSIQHTDCSPSSYSGCQTWQSSYSIQSNVDSLTFVLSHMDSNAECSEHLQADVIKDVLFSQFPLFICIEQPLPPKWGAGYGRFSLFATKLRACACVGEAFYFTALN